MSADGEAYPAKIARLLGELGLPADYGHERSLPLHPEAELTVIADHDPDHAEIRLTPATANAWHALKQAAAGKGITLYAYSGFRSVERQVALIRKKQALGLSVEQILRYTAAPGYSEHHTGRAIDLGTLEQPPLEEVFETTSAFKWLTSHAGHFGFRMSYPRSNRHGIGFEPWHWYFA